MAPPSQPPPAQAGRFKPRAPKKKKATTASSAATASVSQSNMTTTTTADGTGLGFAAPTPEPLEFRREGGGGGRGGGRGARGGRGRRGGGRGRTPRPRGQVFFTADATKGAGGVSRGGGDAEGEGGMGEAAPGMDGAVVIPGSGGAGGGLGGGRRGTATGTDARSRIVEGEEVVVGEMEGGGIGSRRAGEDDPTPLLLRGDGDAFGKSSKFQDDDEHAKVEVGDVSREKAYTYHAGTGLDGDDDDDDSDNDASSATRKHHASSLAAQEERQRRDERKNRGVLDPLQLPFAVPRALNDTMPRWVMYGCQESDMRAGTEMGSNRNHNTFGGANKSGRLRKKQAPTNLVLPIPNQDPPLHNAFLPALSNHDDDDDDLDDDDDDDDFARRKELESWFVVKFPTRLPRLDIGSTVSGRAMKSQAEAEEALRLELGMLADEGKDDENDNDNDAMDVDVGGDKGRQSQQRIANMVAAQTAASMMSASSGGVGLGSSGGGAALGGEGGVGDGAGLSGRYDDTLKDVAPGKYGKIICYKSGKMELVLGGGGEEGDKDPEIKMQITEGLPCSFAQQAVVIDPEERSFIPLGKIKKTLIVTPDIDSAFASS